MTEHERQDRNEARDDIDREAELNRLRTLAEELSTIATALFDREQAEHKLARSSKVLPPLTPEIEEIVSSGDYAKLSGQDMQQFGDMARSVYRGRRLRPRLFADEALFGEPAWDILLDLFIAETDGKPLSVTAACIGAAVPTSTALRWIAILEERGLLSRENDPADARRVFLRLSSGGYARMIAYFMAMQNEGAAGA
jgi:hypothetical protein